MQLQIQKCFSPLPHFKRTWVTWTKKLKQYQRMINKYRHHNLLIISLITSKVTEIWVRNYNVTLVMHKFSCVQGVPKDKRRIFQRGTNLFNFVHWHKSQTKLRLANLAKVQVLSFCLHNMHWHFTSLPAKTNNHFYFRQ